ncbi:MAG: YbaK/EbsC family protein [Candidatus Jorgensenbacteria bacterium]|nr:YbaK/EbsC family protein [Candidatus Jorgensenbacteria bacterium]
MDTPFEKIKKLLTDNNIKYELFEHAPVYTSEEAAKVRNSPLSQGAKSLLLKTENSFVLAIIPGDKKLDSKKLRKAVGVKSIRFATPEEVKEIMGCEIGACYPFGNIIGVKTIVDENLMNVDNIFFNPGVHDKTIKLDRECYQSIVNPEIADVVQV